MRQPTAHAVMTTAMLGACWLALPMRLEAQRAHAARRAMTRTECARSTVGHSRLGSAYEVVGCGPAVLLLHGFSADRRMWQPLVTHWRSRFRLVMPDLKSHGRSIMASATDDPVAEVLAVLDELAIERVAVVGHSAGAALAVDVAAHVPTRVSALVLLSPSVNGLAPTNPPDLSAVAAHVHAHDPAGAAEAWLASPVMQTTLRGPSARWFMSMIRDNARVWDQHGGRPAAPHASAAERIAAVHAPLLVVLGANDASGTADVADSIVAAHADATVQHVANGGHWFPIEAPAGVSRMVTQFLAAQTGVVK